MKIVDFLLSFVLLIILSSCGNDCKTCDMDGDLMGEFCGEDLEVVRAEFPEARCK
jgi:hypothetical protein